VHVVPAVDERVDEVRADETSPSGDDHTHGRPMLSAVRVDS
jgi:hypothetical protein